MHVHCRRPLKIDRLSGAVTTPRPTLAVEEGRSTYRKRMDVVHVVVKQSGRLVN